jgi:WD40-like Beta Propeller Repeat
MIMSVLNINKSINQALLGMKQVIYYLALILFLSKEFYHNNYNYRQVMKHFNLFSFILLLTITSDINAQGIQIVNEAEINTSFQEYSPAFYKDGLVFITSNPAVAKVKQSDNNTGKGTTSIFLSKPTENGLLGKPNPFAESLTTSFYDGPLCFSSDGSMVYFTRSNLKNNKPIKAKDGLVKLKIYSAQLKGEKWENIVEMPFNNKEYDFTHPSISPDGRRLYFASNRPGGFGGMDLYVATLIDGKWTEPVNLGPKINTPKDEVFPFIHADGKVYYSSNGKARNIGGLDIYFTAKTDTGWLVPHLLPEPINSHSDDFGLIMSFDKRFGYFSSNRSSGKGDDDIYLFNTAQNLRIEFFIPQELSNPSPNNGEVVENTTENKADVPVGEVKSIEKTNIPTTTETTVADVKPDISTPKVEPVKEVVAKVEEKKPEIVAPKVEPVKEIAAKVEEKKPEIVVPKVEPVKEVVAKVEEKKPEIVAPKVEPVKEVVAKVEEKKPEIVAPKVEPVKEVVAKVEEKKPEIVAPKVEPVKEVVAKVEEKKPEIVAPKVESVKEIVAKVEEKKPEIVAPKVEPVKEIVAKVEETKAEKRAKKKREAEQKAKPVVEPAKEVVAEVEAKKQEIAVPKPVEKVQIPTPVVEPAKEVVAIKEEQKSEMPAEKMSLEKPVVVPTVEPVKEIVVVKEEVKSEMPAEKIFVEKPQIATPKVEPVKEVVVKVEEKKVEKTAEPVKEVVAKVEETKAEKRAKKKREAEQKAKLLEPVKEVVAKVEEKKQEIESPKPVEKVEEIKAIVAAPVVEPIIERVIKKEDISTTTMVVVDPNVINIIEMTPSVVTTISDANFVEPTTDSHKTETVNINIVNKPESENVNVSPNVKNEHSGSVRCKYLVVVGTYAAEKNAIIQQKIVKNKGYADVEVIHYKDKNLYGVCVKQSNDEKEAYSVAKTVSKGGIDAFVKVLK